MKQAFRDSNEHSYLDPLPEPLTADSEPGIMLGYIRILHGVALGASFMAFYPIGAIIIHYGNFKNAFTYHWTCQLSLTIACFVTVAMGLIFSGNGLEVSQNIFVKHSAQC